MSASPALLSPQARAVVADAQTMREEHEENVLSALWQYFTACGEFRHFSAIVLMPGLYLRSPGRIAICHALVLCNGEPWKAETWLIKNYCLPNVDWRGVLAKAKHFPMHPRGAHVSAEWLVNNRRGA